LTEFQVKEIVDAASAKAKKPTKFHFVNTEKCYLVLTVHPPVIHKLLQDPNIITVSKYEVSDSASLKSNDHFLKKRKVMPQVTILHQEGERWFKVGLVKSGDVLKVMIFEHNSEEDEPIRLIMSLAVSEKIEGEPQHQRRFYEDNQNRLQLKVLYKGHNPLFGDFHLKRDIPISFSHAIVYSNYEIEFDDGF